MQSESRSQWSLILKKRFSPLLFTQFFGAFNDNIYKNALVLMIAYQLAGPLAMEADLLINAAAGLFILPFFLFSALAGQIADKYEKSMLIRRVKQLEVLIMTAALAAFLLNSITALLALLFLMGTQSAFFGPVKYSIIPQHLKPSELVGGNALVEMGTFLAILLGTITAGILVQHTSGPVIGVTVLAVALAGWFTSRHIPRAKSATPGLGLSFNLVSQTWKTIEIARASKPLFLSILAVSWFWLLGAAYITQFPNFAQTALNGSESVVTMLLACFSIGIGLGSLLCEKLSGKQVELGLVPLGAVGLTLFGLDLCFAYTPARGISPVSFQAFLASPGSFRVIADLVLMGISGGVYTVPLYAYIQSRTPQEKRARVIAANNILNALFMVVAAVAGVLLIGVLDLTVTQFYIVLAVSNLVVTAWIFRTVPDFFLRFAVWGIGRFMYRTRHQGLSQVPATGPCILVSNHVSLVDWLLITGACRRPIRFVIYEPIYRLPVLNLIFRIAKAIPIHSRQKNPHVYHQAFKQMQKVLENGEVLCIFPEGKLTCDGEIDVFKKGIEKLMKTHPVPVVPMAIRGMWGSFFSHRNGRALRSMPRRFWSRVELIIGAPMVPECFDITRLRQEVMGLRQGCQ